MWPLSLAQNRQGCYCPAVSEQISFNWLFKIFMDNWMKSHVKSKCFKSLIFNLFQSSKWAQSQTLSEQSNSIYPVRMKIRRVLIQGVIRLAGNIRATQLPECTRLILGVIRADHVHLWCTNLKVYQTYPKCDKGGPRTVRSGTIVPPQIVLCQMYHQSDAMISAK